MKGWIGDGIQFTKNRQYWPSRKRGKCIRGVDAVMGKGRFSVDLTKKLTTNSKGRTLKKGGE